MPGVPQHPEEWFLLECILLQGYWVTLEEGKVTIYSIIMQVVAS